jgi:uncharacterized protein
MISAELIRLLLKEYALPGDGVHGLAHWARVLETGLRLAEKTGADPEVVRLFAVFHDARRINEGWDQGHGRRGAELAASLRGTGFRLPGDKFDLLYAACVYHTDGLTDGDATVQTCWDADRLDLGRVGIAPKRKFLGTEAARDAENMSWAEERSRLGLVPDLVLDHWGIKIR